MLLMSKVQGWSKNAISVMLSGQPWVKKVVVELLEAICGEIEGSANFEG